jgi:nitroimidazol reductase NimA-like FMN-containing flavoprotein (pyridoxamine 5'-phosphate oxidase superfamily)
MTTLIFTSIHLQGRKVEMMRQNNEVCFEVDEIYDMSNWKSVVAWGAFEELKGSHERQKALKNSF